MVFFEDLLKLMIFAYKNREKTVKQYKHTIRQTYKIAFKPYKGMAS